MSDLIDRGELVDRIFDGVLAIKKSDEPNKAIKIAIDIIEEIKQAPKVLSIPVEWIEQYGERNFFDYGTQYNAITQMLGAWEKETEDKL